MAKQAILAISYGTAYPNADQSINTLESTLAKHFPAYDLFRAYTSSPVIEKLRARGETVQTPAEALKLLHRQGYEHVFCVPLFLLMGTEYQKLSREIEHFPADSFCTLCLTDCLLSGSRKNETACVSALAPFIPSPKEGCLLLMGHGTGDKQAEKSYYRLETRFHDMGYENVLIANMQGRRSLQEVLPLLQEQNSKAVRLMPLMISAGRHAHVVLSGSAPDSWSSILSREGYQAQSILIGLGSLPEIGEAFCRCLQDTVRAMGHQ